MNNNRLNKAIKVLVIAILAGYFIILTPKIISAILNILGISIYGYN